MSDESPESPPCPHSYLTYRNRRLACKACGSEIRASDLQPGSKLEVYLRCTACDTEYVTHPTILPTVTDISPVVIDSQCPTGHPLEFEAPLGTDPHSEWRMV